MGFNRRKMEDERRREADKQAAARIAAAHEICDPCLFMTEQVRLRSGMS